MFLFITDRNLSWSQIVPSPLELNDTVVSKVERFKAIVCPSNESLFDKSWIMIFIVKPVPIGFAFSAFLFGHSLFVLYSLTLDLSNFVADGFSIGVVIKV